MAQLTVTYHDGEQVTGEYADLDALMRTVGFVSQCTLTVHSVTIRL